MSNIFDELSKVNVNGHTETKNGLTYLSWAWAWSEVMKRFPDASYNIKWFDGKPYMYEENVGYMVWTEVTIGDETRTMWLPVMDGSNKAMMNKPYEWYDRYKKPHRVDTATMFDINKTIMRCLVKNLAMFGLGIYIYAGEDIPECESELKKENNEELNESEINNIREQMFTNKNDEDKQVEMVIVTNYVSQLLDAEKKWIVKQQKLNDESEITENLACQYLEFKAKKQKEMKKNGTSN